MLTRTHRLICVALFAGIATVASAQTVTDPNLRVQRWVRGLQQPTGLAFVDNAGTALALEKNTGRVQIIAGKTIAGTALDLPVANDSERGLLGIALSPDFATSKFVYLYYTHADRDGAAAVDNRVVRYQWDGTKLVFNKRVAKLPASPGPNHDGGKIAFGRDGKLYIATGDLNRNGKTANFQQSSDLTRSGAILRLNPSGTSVGTNPFFNRANVGTTNAPLNDIYAYGVRNSFGIDFDPVTGDLWDTENGPGNWDEINRVRPGFNSGWQDVMGPASRTGESTEGLVSFGDRFYYSDPRFSWNEPIAPTDAMFLASGRLGDEYRNDLFVGTVKGGAILKFDLSPSRKTLALSGALADTVADNSSSALFAEQSEVLFGQGFGTIIDLIQGPGGMYVLSLGNGTLYRITTVTADARLAALDLGGMAPEPSAIGVILPAWLLVRRCRGGRR